MNCNVCGILNNFNIMLVPSKVRVWFSYLSSVPFFCTHHHSSLCMKKQADISVPAAVAICHTWTAAELYILIYLMYTKHKSTMSSCQWTTKFSNLLILCQLQVFYSIILAPTIMKNAYTTAEDWTPHKLKPKQLSF